MKIKDLANWNPWWQGKLRAIEAWQKYYNFAFLTKERELDFNKNWIIRGPRQVGKTFFLHKVMNEIVVKEISQPETLTYISCDRLGGRRELRNTIKELKELMRGFSKEKFLFLDEITSIRDWENIYKEICEEEFFRVIATGSRPKELEKKAEYFPGRNVEIFNFYPLSFKEFLVSFLNSYLSDGKFGILKIYRSEAYISLSSFFKNHQIPINQEIAQNLLENLKKLTYPFVENFKSFYKFFQLIDFLFRIYLETGGYPAIIEEKIKGKELSKELVIKDTLGTIEKEGLNSEFLSVIIPQLLTNLCSKINYSQLARELGIDTATTIKYIETLEKSFILREIYFYDGKVHPKKEKKIYFSDPFMIRAFESYFGLKESEEGKIVENVTAEHLTRWIEDPFRISWKHRMGYSKERGKEIDFLIKTEKETLKIEAKYKESISEPLKNLDFILTKEDFEISEKPYKIPVSIFLLSLK